MAFEKSGLGGCENLQLQKPMSIYNLQTGKSRKKCRLPQNPLVSTCFWRQIEGLGRKKQRWAGNRFVRREEGNVHSPPDIDYSKDPTKGKRLMRRPAPAQEPTAKTEADAAENNSAGGGDHRRGTKGYLFTPCRQVVPLNENSTLSFLILTTCAPDMVSPSWTMSVPIRADGFLSL